MAEEIKRAGGSGTAGNGTPRTPAAGNRERVLGINGLGRIGKLALWHHAGRKHFQRIVVNQGREVGRGLAAVAEMLEKDSTYGALHRFLHGHRAPRVIELLDQGKGELLVDGVPVTVLRSSRNPRDLPWRDYGVEVVVDCTGKFNDPTLPPDHPKGSLRGHLAAGARQVLNSAPFKIKDQAARLPPDAVCLIFGINHRQFDPDNQTLISAASCTTTALAHMIQPLLEYFQTEAILTASMSTVHAVTNTQSVLDAVPAAGASDLRKSRSALNNIIITSTGAAGALEAVIPGVRDIGFMADSVRVPVATSSLIILNLTFQSRIDKDGRSAITAQRINQVYREAAAGKQQDLLRFTMEQNVSADLIGDPASVVIEGCETHTRTGFISLDLREVPGWPEEAAAGLRRAPLKVPVTHAKIFGWYDNEYGSYTNRLADLTVYVQDCL